MSFLIRSTIKKLIHIITTIVFLLYFLWYQPEKTKFYHLYMNKIFIGTIRGIDLSPIDNFSEDLAEIIFKKIRVQIRPVIMSKRMAEQKALKQGALYGAFIGLVIEEQERSPFFLFTIPYAEYNYTIPPAILAQLFLTSSMVASLGSESRALVMRTFSEAPLLRDIFFTMRSLLQSLLLYYGKKKYLVIGISHEHSWLVLIINNILRIMKRQGTISSLMKKAKVD